MQIEIHSVFFPADAVELFKTRGARIHKLVAVNEQAEFNGSGVLLVEAENTTITNSSIVGFLNSISIIRSSGVPEGPDLSCSPEAQALVDSGELSFNPVARLN